MNTPDGPATPPVPTPQPAPNWKQAFVLLAGGLVLAATACFGFLFSLGSNFNTGGNVLTPVAAVLFVVGLVAAFVGVIKLLVLIVRAVRQKPGGGAA